MEASVAFTIGITSSSTDPYNTCLSKCNITKLFLVPLPGSDSRTEGAPADFSIKSLQNSHYGAALWVFASKETWETSCPQDEIEAEVASSPGMTAFLFQHLYSILAMTIIQKNKDKLGIHSLSAIILLKETRN